jgi:hypothetical protein
LMVMARPVGRRGLPVSTHRLNAPMQGAVFSGSVQIALEDLPNA